MDHEFDLVIRNGIVVDGTGGVERLADVAVSGSRIRLVGEVAGRGREEIDAGGKIVTPGFVDIHTHYDGQAIWSDRLSPSSDHGATTVVMGNCGVGFAPCRPEARDAIMTLMEGIEDIPRNVMQAGLPWSWESFPQYLDVLDEQRTDIDFAAQLPHGPLRVFVMGQRGLDREPATREDLAAMRALTTEALTAGAIGVSTSRTPTHRTRDGTLAPVIGAGIDELLSLAIGMRDAGAGVFEVAPDANSDPAVELDIVRQVAGLSGRPVSMACVQNPARPQAWEQVMRGLDSAAADGLEIRAQILPRPGGLIQGLDISVHGFAFHPSFKAIAHLPLPELVATMRDPDVRRRILAEQPEHTNPYMLELISRTETTYRLGDPPNYEPAPETSIAAEAQRLGLAAADHYYDVLLEKEGRNLLYTPLFNFIGSKSDALRRMIAHPHTVAALGDGGAHLGMICDASYSTYMLTRWRAGQANPDGFTLPWIIEQLTRIPAQTMGLHDRGLLATGYKADINLIDLERLRLHAPHTVCDLPEKAKRLTQRVDGYAATIVSGRVVYRDGQDSGERPGRLVRAGRP